MAGAFLVAKLCALDARLGEAAPRLLASADDEAVHDLRVALRRTRTLLEVGRPVFGRFHADEVRRRAARRAARDGRAPRRGGAPRAARVARRRPARVTLVREQRRDWLEGRRRRERRLRSALRRKVREGELDRGRQLLAALLAFRIKPSRDRRVDEVRAPRGRGREARGGAPAARRRSTTPRRCTTCASRYKRLRYTVETFATVLPERPRALAQPAARFQSRLGGCTTWTSPSLASRTRRTSSTPGAKLSWSSSIRVRRDRVAALEEELGGADIASSPVKVRLVANLAGRATSA